MYIYRNLIEALRESNATSAHSWALLNLAAYHNQETGKCCPTQKRQAEDTGISPKTIRAAISFAEEQGWLTKRVLARRGSQFIYQYDWSPILTEKQAKPKRQREGSRFAAELGVAREAAKTELGLLKDESAAREDSAAAEVTTVASVLRETSVPPPGDMSTAAEGSGYRRSTVAVTDRTTNELTKDIYQKRTTNASEGFGNNTEDDKTDLQPTRPSRTYRDLVRNTTVEPPPRELTTLDKRYLTNLRERMNLPAPNEPPVDESSAVADDSTVNEVSVEVRGVATIRKELEWAKLFHTPHPRKSEDWLAKNALKIEALEQELAEAEARDAVSAEVDPTV